MSYPPGPPDPDGPRDPWATPSSEPGGAGPQPGQQPGQQPGEPSGQPSGPPPYGPPPGYGQQPYAQSPYGPPPGYGGQYGGPPTNGKAQAALWTGIGLLVTSCCLLGFLGFIPILLGVRARREIRESGGQQGGDGMALAGIITGAVAIVISLLALALLVGVVATGSSGFTSYSDTGV